MAVTYHAGRRIQGNTNVSGWVDINDTTYDSIEFSVASQETQPQGVNFKSDGTKMYIIGKVNDRIYQYSLSTAWDLSTASYDSVSFSISTQDGAPRELFFKSDGLKMYMLGDDNDKVFQYSLSTAWDITTTSYDSVSFSVGTTVPCSLYFKPDGLKMYVEGRGSDVVRQYSLSTAWDLSTASYDNVSFSIGGQDGSFEGMFFKSDGTKMYLVGFDNDTVYQYSLSTAWDLSTASYDSVSFGVGSQVTTPTSLAFKTDGTKMYVVDWDDDKVYQYSTSFITSDYTTITNAQVGSRFEETDTRKMYSFDSINKSGCLIYYNFEQTSGNLINQATTANGFTDGLGSTGDGTSSGTVGKSNTGKVGSNAWSFDGSSGKTASSNSSDLILTGDTSWAGWIKIDSSTSTGAPTIFSVRGATGNSQVDNALFCSYLSKNTSPIDLIVFHEHDAGINVSPSINIDSNLSTGVWNHFAVTRDVSEKQYSVYVDGSLLSTHTYNTNPNTTATSLDFELGHTAADDYFDGMLDEVSLWNRVLTADEISALYNSGTGATVDNAKYWKEIGT